jgi:translation initiation factor 1 (eIF-1/SUI1)
MPSPEPMDHVTGNMVASFETSSQNIESLFDAAHQILEGFQNSFFDTRREREDINTQLRENLTANESLRRKDFDLMMQDILSAQEDRERHVREELNMYLADQREMIRSLGENMAKFKDALAGGEAQRVKEFQTLLQGILAAQDERKSKVTSELKEFQTQQQELAKTLKGLLAKGRELRIKDLKRMLGEFRSQRQERIIAQGERRKDVRDMLEESQKERSAGAKSRQELQKKAMQARTSPDGPGI